MTQQTARHVLVFTRNHTPKHARQQRQHQLISHGRVPRGAHVAWVAFVRVRDVRDARNGLAILRRPEVAVQDDLPRGWVAEPLRDSSINGTLRRVGFVGKRQIGGPPQPKAETSTLLGSRPQDRDCGMCEAFLGHKATLAALPLLNLWPVGRRPFAPKLFGSNRLGTHDAPIEVVGGDRACKRPNFAWIIVAVSAHPFGFRWSRYASHRLSTTDVARVVGAGRSDSTQVATLGQ